VEGIGRAGVFSADFFGISCCLKKISGNFFEWKTANGFQALRTLKIFFTGPDFPGKFPGQVL
jgi:hypothetical protein